MRVTWQVTNCSSCVYSRNGLRLWWDERPRSCCIRDLVQLGSPAALGPGTLILCAEGTTDLGILWWVPRKVRRAAAEAGAPGAAFLSAITASYLHSLSLRKYLLSAWSFCLFCTIPTAESQTRSLEVIGPELADTAPPTLCGDPTSPGSGPSVFC